MNSDDFRKHAKMIDISEEDLAFIENARERLEAHSRRIQKEITREMLSKLSHFQTFRIMALYATIEALKALESSERFPGNQLS